MAELSHEPIDINQWNGLFARGSADNVPPGFFIDTLNTRFTQGEVFTREGSNTFILTGSTAPNFTRIFSYESSGGSRFLGLDYTAGNGSVYDIGIGPPGTLISGAGIPGGFDFSVISFNGRAYVSVHNRTVGISSRAMFVYDPTLAIMRSTGGAAPSTNLTPTNSATAGNCEAGTHIISYAFLTDTGFVTAPAVGNTVVCTGGKKIDLASVDVGAGGTGTIARIIVATKTIQNYNGNLLGYPFFIVPSANGGLINDNTTTTGTLSFFDSELVESADYLLDNRAFTPAGIGMCEYKGRMVVWGISGDVHSVYLSKPYAPEQFDAVGGFITVDPFGSTEGVRNCFVFRGSLIICKSHKTYITTDNDKDPVTWPIDVIDNGVGTECFGVGTIIDSKGQQNDRAFIADYSGLIIFEGYTRRPEGSWLVEDVWKRINRIEFDLIQVCCDPINSSFFVSLPLDGASTITHVLYGYYGAAMEDGGFDPKRIKYSLWQFALGSISMFMSLEVTTNEPTLNFLGTAGNVYIYKQNKIIHSGDHSLPYPSYVKLGLLTSKRGWINHFGAVRLRVTGVGTLNTSISGEDGVDNTSLADYTMSLAPGKEVLLTTNFKNEKASIKFATGANVSDRFFINSIQLFAKPLWLTRPA